MYLLYQFFITQQENVWKTFQNKISVAVGPLQKFYSYFIMIFILYFLDFVGVGPLQN